MNKPSIAKQSPSFARLVQEFFTEHLVVQRALSPCTVASYRDAMMLFLEFAGNKLKKLPVKLALADLQPELILDFLKHLEDDRGNTVRSRNLRLTALRTFLKFAARRDVTQFGMIQSSLSVPTKRHEQPMLGYLTRDEMVAILSEHGDTWTSRRDHLLFALMYNTGARVSEVTAITVEDVILGEGPCVHLRGKGRKLRSVPLWKSTVTEVRSWINYNAGQEKGSALFPNRDGNQMSRSNVNKRLKIAVQKAAKIQPSISRKAVSPHTVRHTTAMHLLQSGVPFNVIALWLGHESVNTTHRYVEADLEMKEQALAKLDQPDCKTGRYKPADSLIDFLQSL